MSTSQVPVGIAGLLPAQAESTPDASAMVDAGRTWTYAELANRAGKVGTALRVEGVGAGNRVGVYCNKGVDGFIAMHAIVSIGAVAVPLDPASPPARLASICDQLQIEVVASHAPRRAPLVDVAADERGATRSIFVDDEALDTLDSAAFLEGIDENAPAYVITTSGSTGEPKGMVHTHRSARAYADMTVRTYGLGPQDRVSDIAPHHFDISTHSLWSVPLVGATNVVVNEAYQRLPASHSQLLEDESVTYWYSVPFLLQQLLTRGDLENRDLSALRWVHFGGEVVAPEVIGQMMQHCPNAKFANIFGPAETNQCSLAVFDEPPRSDRPLSVGFPLDHSVIRAIDVDADVPSQDNEVPAGETGEMWAATPQLMEGYWGNPELNDQVLKYVDGLRFYRTGDLISVDKAGEISFFGRRDHQVKVRGYRIELEGVELELGKLGFAEHVVVAVLRAHSGEDELVAGVLGVTGELDEEEFLRAAASVIPAYAIPARMVRLSEPSFTGSGKLNRRLLREKVGEIAQQGTDNRKGPAT